MLQMGRKSTKVGFCGNILTVIGVSKNKSTEAFSETGNIFGHFPKYAFVFYVPRFTHLHALTYTFSACKGEHEKDPYCGACEAI